MEQKNVILAPFAIYEQHNLKLDSLNSARYLVTPLFIPPEAKVKAIAAKLLICPKSATPDGPIITATTLIDTNPVNILTKVENAVSEKTLTIPSFEKIFRNIILILSNCLWFAQ